MSRMVRRLQRVLVLCSLVPFAWLGYCTLSPAAQEATEPEESAVDLPELQRHGLAYVAEESAERFSPAQIRKTYRQLEDALAVVRYAFEYYSRSGQEKTKRRGYCLGVLVSEAGLVMAPGHVYVGEQKPFNVTVELASGEKYDAEALEKDKKVNVMFFRINNEEGVEFPYVRFAEKPVIDLADEVMVMGISTQQLDFERTYDIARVTSAIERPRSVYVTDMPPRFGLRGGPVINTGGEVVGVVGYDLSPTEGGEIYVRYGTPLIYTSDIFAHLIANPPTEEEEEKHAWMGIFTQPLTEDFARYLGLDSPGGIIVSTIVKGAPAEQAGIQEGDVILKFGDIPVTARLDRDVVNFTKMVRDTDVGTKVPLIIWRERAQQTVELTLGESPKDSGDAEQYEDKDLGLTVREITADFIIFSELDPDTEGVVVHRAKRGGWASLAGLATNDIIKEIDGKKVGSLEDFKAVLSQIKNEKAGQVLMFVQRGVRTGFFKLEPRWSEDR